MLGFVFTNYGKVPNSLYYYPIVWGYLKECHGASHHDKFHGEGCLLTSVIEELFRLIPLVKIYCKIQNIWLNVSNSVHLNLSYMKTYALKNPPKWGAIQTAFSHPTPEW